MDFSDQNVLGILWIDGARAALYLDGTMLGYYPVRVLPSKTAILPVNPKFLPRVCNLNQLVQFSTCNLLAFVHC